MAIRARAPTQQRTLINLLLFSQPVRDGVSDLSNLESVTFHGRTIWIVDAHRGLTLSPKTGKETIADQGDVGFPSGILRKYSLLGVDAVEQRRPTDQYQEKRNEIPFL